MILNYEKTAMGNQGQPVILQVGMVIQVPSILDANTPKILRVNNIKRAGDKQVVVFVSVYTDLYNYSLGKEMIRIVTRPSELTFCKVINI